jgi:hypothetical protein
MIKTLTTLLVLTISFCSQGQKTRQVKSKDKNGDLEIGASIVIPVDHRFIGIFNVLDSDKNIKQGSYEKYFEYSDPRGKLLIERGQYYNNKKTGTWSFYWGENNILSKGNYDSGLRSGSWEYYKNGIVVEKGDYKNDKKEGLWTYVEKVKGILENGFYKEGKKIGKWTYNYYNLPVQTYDYTLDSVLQFLDDKSESEVIDSNNEIVKLVLSRPPQYIGHKRQLQADLTSLTEYPFEARRFGIEGVVVVSFFVNTDGTTSDFTIIQDIGGNCGQAVIKAFKSNQNKWVPGTYEGKKVKVKYYQSVSFSLRMDSISGLGRVEIVYE